jgi:hypothetical protein
MITANPRVDQLAELQGELISAVRHHAHCGDGRERGEIMDDLLNRIGMPDLEGALGKIRSINAAAKLARQRLDEIGT